MKEKSNERSDQSCCCCDCDCDSGGCFLCAKDFTSSGKRLNERRRRRRRWRQRGFGSRLCCSAGLSNQYQCRHTLTARRVHHQQQPQPQRQQTERAHELTYTHAHAQTSESQSQRQRQPLRSLSLVCAQMCRVSCCVAASAAAAACAASLPAAAAAASKLSTLYRCVQIQFRSRTEKTFLNLLLFFYTHFSFRLFFGGTNNNNNSSSNPTLSAEQSRGSAAQIR